MPALFKLVCSSIITVTLLSIPMLASAGVNQALNPAPFASASGGVAVGFLCLIVAGLATMLRRGRDTSADKPKPMPVPLKALTREEFVRRHRRHG